MSLIACCRYPRTAFVHVGVALLALTSAPVSAGQELSPSKPTTPAGAEQGQTFEDRGDDGSLLVGLEVTLGFSGVDQIVTSVQPLYAGKDGVKSSKRYGAPTPHRVRVEAKSGYAVGAVQVKAAEQQIDGMRVVFMRRKGNALDPKDAYESRWLGGTGGKKDQERKPEANKSRQLAGGGNPIIGVTGRVEKVLTAFNLIESK